MNGMVMSVNEVKMGAHHVPLMTYLERLKSFALLQGYCGYQMPIPLIGLCWYHQPLTASTQKKMNKLIQERREADEKEFGVATIDTFLNLLRISALCI